MHLYRDYVILYYGIAHFELLMDTYLAMAHDEGHA